jgi:chromate transporter
VSGEGPVAPSFAQALRFWWRLGWISFGGPAGQIAIMHTELVERRRWVTDAAFLRGLNFCMLLPGPEAQQLATWLGWRLHGVRGGFAAGILFVLPAVALLWALSWLYVAYGDVPQLAGVQDGLKAAVLALIVHALWRLAGRTLRTPAAMALALSALAALGLARVPFPLVVAAAALAGVLLSRVMPQALGSATGGGDGEAIHSPPGAVPGALRASLACVLLWLAPVVALQLAGPDTTLARMGLFFSQAALVTFGGAYAVLPYVAGHAVDVGWLDTPQMIVGLGLAETTPGPLIMVLEFVGFVGAWTHPDGMPPLLAASVAALLTVWVTFLPSFALVFAGAPWIDRLDRVATLRHALRAVTAAVIGVIAHLFLWFAAGVLLVPGGVRWYLAVLAVLLFVLLHHRKLPVPLVVLLGAVAGGADRALSGA